LYWERKFEEINGEIGFLPPGYLFFSDSILDLPYIHETDKTLMPVGIGLSEKKLIALGYEETKLKNGRSIFTGYRIIPIDLLDKILFRNNKDLGQIGQRYANYLEQVPMKIISIEENNEFGSGNSAPTKIKKLSKQHLTKKIESRISRTISSVGNALIELNDNERNSYIFLFDIVASYLRGEVKKGFGDIKEGLKEFNWSFKEPEIISIALMISSNWSEDLKTQEKQIQKFSTSSKINIKDFDIHLCLVFVRSINTVLSNVNDGNGIKNSNRIDILIEIINQHEGDLKSSKTQDSSILEILNNIQGVFDYSIDPEQLNIAIDKIQCPVLDIIVRGFNSFIQEPIKKSKLKVLLGNETALPSELCEVFAFFVWGRAQGAFAFEPKSKSDMLACFSPKGFYRICFNSNDLNEFNFSLIDNNKLLPASKSEELFFGEYKINISENGKIAHKTYEEIKFSIRTSNGLTLYENKKDSYLDVFDKMSVLLDSSELDNDDFRFFLNEYLKSEVSIQLGSNNLLADSIEEIRISSNQKEEIQIEIKNNEIRSFIYLPQSVIHENLLLFLKEKFSDPNNFENVSLSEKKKAREYFSLKIGLNTMISNKTNKQVSTPDEDIQYQKWNVPDLKTYMKERNIKPLTGNKQALISRIIDNKNKN
jgi:hypothetical protein